MDYKQTETPKVKIPDCKQLYGRLLGFGKVFRFRKVKAGACRPFVAPAPQQLQLDALAKMLSYGASQPWFLRRP